MACALLVLAPLYAAAAPPDAAELTRTGVQAFRQGDYAQAARALEQAYALEPKAALLFVMARSYEEVGQLAKAESAYQRYLDAGVSGEDRARAERRLSGVRLRIKNSRAVLVIRVSPSNARVSVGKERFDPGPVRVELKPGTYELAAEAQGYDTLNRSITLAGGTTRDVEMSLEKPAKKVAPQPPVAPVPTEMSTQEVVGWSLLATGGAAVLTAVGLHAASLAAHADGEPVDADGDGRADIPREEARTHNERGNALGVGAIVTYSLGGVLVATGLALALTAEDVPVSGALMPTPGGAVLGLGGRF